MDDPAAQPSFHRRRQPADAARHRPARLDALLALIDGAERIAAHPLLHLCRRRCRAKRVNAALIAAAERGVDGRADRRRVRQRAMPQRTRFFEPLDEAGVDGLPLRAALRAGAICCATTRSWRSPTRRAIIIGGFNIEDDYFGTAAEQAWRDLGLLVEGPAAARLAGYFDALHDWIAAAEARRCARCDALLAQWSETEGATRWLIGGPTRRLSPWARAVRDDMRAGDADRHDRGYFAPSPAMLRRLDRVGRARAACGSCCRRRSINSAAICGGALHLCRAAAQGRADLRISADQAAHQALRDRRRGPYRLGQFRHAQPVPQPRTDAADRGSRRSPRMSAAMSTARSRSRTSHHGVYKAHTGWMQRVKQLGAYFVMAVVDPSVSRGLNFGIDEKPVDLSAIEDVEHRIGCASTECWDELHSADGKAAVGRVRLSADPPSGPDAARASR